MRVLVAHDVPARRSGGMSRIMGFIHDRVAQRGHDVDYLHADDVVSRSPSLRRFSYPVAVYEHARRAQVQGLPFGVLNIHEPSAVASLLGRRLIGRPRIVVTTHGVEQRAWELALEEQRLGRLGPSRWTKTVYPLSSLWQSRAGLRHADHVFCLNEEDRAYLTERFHVDDRRITRIFPAADPIYASTSAHRDYRSARQVLFAGTWRKNKGIEDMVPAFSEILATHSDVTLVVLGSGVTDNTVKDAFPPSVRHAISCVTVRSEAETAAVFASADIFVLPSLFEGTPLTLLEAMASGMPVVTTAVCGMRDVIESGRNGLLIPIRSPREIVLSIRTLLADASLRERLGVAARDDARQRYTWDRSADRVSAVYEQLLDPARLSGRTS